MWSIQPPRILAPNTCTSVLPPSSSGGSFADEGALGCNRSATSSRPRPEERRLSVLEEDTCEGVLVVRFDKDAHGAVVTQIDGWLAIPTPRELGARHRVFPRDVRAADVRDVDDLIGGPGL